MALNINFSVPSIQAQRDLAKSNQSLNRTMERLSTGMRINSARDDAAGVAIAERFNSQSRQYRTEINNLQSGINFAQTADGGLSEQQNAVQRIRDLAVQASNGTMTANNRELLNTEAQQLVEQLNQEAESAEYNGNKVLASDQTLDLGTQGDLALELRASTAESLGMNTVDLSTAEGATAAIDAADNAMNQLSDNRANLGAQMNRFEFAINQRGTSELSSRGAESFLRDADFARETMEMTRGQILTQSGIGALVQSNISSQAVTRLLGV